MLVWDPLPRFVSVSFLFGSPNAEIEMNSIISLNTDNEPLISVRDYTTQLPSVVDENDFDPQSDTLTTPVHDSEVKTEETDMIGEDDQQTPRNFVYGHELY